MPAWVSDRKLTILGSCNGLICLSLSSKTETKYTLHICNPLPQELAMLPQARSDNRARGEHYGCGFSSMTGHYKVLRIYTVDSHQQYSQADVITIGFDKSWRYVDDTYSDLRDRKWSSDGMIRKPHFCEVTLQCALHWMWKDGRRREFIYAFDIDEEQIRAVPPPQGMGKRNKWTSLGVLRGCLCVFNTTCPPNLVILYMNDCGDVNSWTRKSILGEHIPVGLKNCVVHTIASWRDGEILMYAGRGVLISYNPKENRSIEIMNYDGA